MPFSYCGDCYTDSFGFLLFWSFDHFLVICFFIYSVLWIRSSGFGLLDPILENRTDPYHWNSKIFRDSSPHCSKLETKIYLKFPGSLSNLRRILAIKEVLRRLGFDFRARRNVATGDGLVGESALSVEMSLCRCDFKIAAK